MSLDSLYLAYWSLRDPLCQSQVLPVARALARDGYRMGLLTFEQEPWRLERAEQERTAAQLREGGIMWGRVNAQQSHVGGGLDVTLLSLASMIMNMTMTRTARQAGLHQDLN